MINEIITDIVELLETWKTEGSTLEDFSTVVGGHTLVMTDFHPAVQFEFSGEVQFTPGASKCGLELGFWLHAISSSLLTRDEARQDHQALITGLKGSRFTGLAVAAARLGALSYTHAPTGMSFDITAEADVETFEVPQKGEVQHWTHISTARLRFSTILNISQINT